MRVSPADVDPFDGMSVEMVDLVVATADASDRAEERHVSRMLDYIRSTYGMDVVYVSRFGNGKQTVVRVAAAQDDPQALSAGDCFALEETYCQRVIDGRLPDLITNTGANAQAAALGGTSQLGIVSYVCVPIRMDDGSVYGTVCCYNHCETPAFGMRNERDVLEQLARFVRESSERGVDLTCV